MLTTFDLDEYVYEALRAGASGFLLKDAPPDQLVAAVRVVPRGDALLAPPVTRRLIERFAGAPGPRPRSAAGRADRPRARGAGWWPAVGPTPRSPAELYVSEADREDPRRACPGQAGLRDRAQAVVFAYESGLVRPGDS